VKITIAFLSDFNAGILAIQDPTSSILSGDRTKSRDEKNVEFSDFFRKNSYFLCRIRAKKYTQLGLALPPRLI
jgi:hypothetical protein